MKQKYAVWVLAGSAFLATLGITSWRNGLWSSDEPGAQPVKAASSRSINTPNPIPKDPFQATGVPPAAPAPAPAQPTQSAPEPLPPPPEPAVGIASSPPPYTQSAPPDPISEQSQDDYKQRAKLMEEIAARAR